MLIALKDSTRKWRGLILASPDDDFDPHDGVRRRYRHRHAVSVWSSAAVTYTVTIPSTAGNLQHWLPLTLVVPSETSLNEMVGYLIPLVAGHHVLGHALQADGRVRE
jgi:hypothetical protein